MTRQKHRPQRTCIACRQTKDKRDLVRVVRTPDQHVVIDPTGKANGRGVYLCRQASCWQKGLKKERLSHALKVAVSASDMEQIWQALETEH
ncbi:MAG: YlxR family protein [Chloroflexi bacterium]|nr:MAG: YlxR family protein [Chloroflexota bacterium]